MTGRDVVAVSVDSATCLADRDVAAFVVDAAVVGPSRRHVDSFTRLQSAYACDTRLAMDCFCAVRRYYTRRKEER